MGRGLGGDGERDLPRLFTLKVSTIHRAHVQSFTSYSVFPRDPTLWGKSEVRLCLL